jgi:predicted HicB family RNase H-like nuclease
VDILKYKDYEGTAELNMTRRVCRGKILFINDLVTYEASQPSELQKEFEAAVDDYVATCADLGREPQKSLKGQFNVRIPQELHKASALRALTDSVSLNDVVVRALDAYVNARVDINHVETKNYFVGYGEFQDVVANASSLSNQEFSYGGLSLATSVLVPSNAVNVVNLGGKRATARH